MIDHVSVRVQDFPRLLEFYKAALAPLGYELVMEFPGAAGLGAGGKPDVWLMQTDRPLNPTHLALAAGREVVDAFHDAALAAGGLDNGPPGLRPDYHPHYYAAFIHDPEGNNIEVVCHDDPDAKRAAVRASSSKPAARKPAARKPAKNKALEQSKARTSPKKPAKRAPARKTAAKPARGRGAAKKKPRR
jgi:catechol 2,3-dioxygenase-like lactoylglutathione lyase family enzyme